MKKIIKKVLGESTIGKIKSIKKQLIGDKKEIQLRKKRIEFYAQFIKEGDICFDVGANVGNRVYPLLKLKANVVAIEPQRPCIEELKKRFGNKINIVTKGLGEKEETKEFFLSNSSTLSTFSKDYIDSVKDGRFAEYEWNQVETVEMTTLNNLIKQFGVPKFIKIDVEGYELEVLKGLDTPVKMLSFEYFVPEQLARARDCINRVKKIGGNIEINYSVGESMNFELDRWLSIEEMLHHMNQPVFTTTDFGDIYIRNLSV